MKKRLLQKWYNRFFNIVVNKRNGSSMPLVMLVALVVLVIGSAVALSTVQVHNIVMRDKNDQLAYFAAESAIERSICNLDSYLSKEGFASSRGIAYSSEALFISKIIDALNTDDAEIHNKYDGTDGANDVNVYGSAAMNGAKVKLQYSWDGSTYTNIGIKQLRFPITIKASATLENGLLKSYGKTAVATREFTVRIPDRFELLGAVYTLGDLVAKGAAGTSSKIVGDTYVFGSGTEIANTMKMHHNGGICAIDSTTLNIDGNAFTRGLVRAGLFSEDAASTESCTINVSKDIVAQGIQIFGSYDYIYCNRDAYTFDDIEMNGPNSIIAIKGNYFGLNPGDDQRHDTSSAIINVAPQYALESGYWRSRIVINGGVYNNGVTFRIKDAVTGEVGHKMEDASLGWIGTQTVYNAKGIGPDKTNTDQYIAELETLGANGFSVLLQAGWSNVNSGWDTWKNEIISKIGDKSNIFTNKPDKIVGYCNHAFSANDGVYFIKNNESETKVIKPTSGIVCNVSESVKALTQDYWDTYTGMQWSYYKDVYGMPKALKQMGDILLDHVQVFANKSYLPYDPDDPSTNILQYSFDPGLHGRTEFMTIAHELDSIGASDYIIKYPSTSNSDSVDVVDELESSFPLLVDSDGDGIPEAPSANPYTNFYFLVLNFNPDKELVISREMNGIIFSLGKVTFSQNGKLNGSVIAAGNGYDSTSKVSGSSAEFENESAGKTRLPRVNDANYSNFTAWDYAAVVFDGGGSIEFPSGSDMTAGRAALLDKFLDQGIDLYGIF